MVQNTFLNLLARDLEQSGCATRFKNARTLEVYGVNLSDHYLLTLKKYSEDACDILFVPQLQSYTVSTKH